MTSQELQGQRADPGERSGRVSTPGPGVTGAERAAVSISHHHTSARASAMPTLAFLVTLYFFYQNTYCMTTVIPSTSYV